MSRDELQAILDAHVPADAKEEADRAAMLHFLELLPSPFSAAQHAAHFTASALIVDPSRERTCLVLHRKLGLWLQPGGHVEAADRSIALAALREAQEETGLDAQLAADLPVHLDVHEIPERPDLPAHLHLDVRFLTIADGEPTLSEESTAVRWWPLADAVEAGDDSLARLIRAAV